MNIYLFVIFLALNCIFYLSKPSLRLLVLSMFSTLFLVNILPVEVDFIKYFFIGITFLYFVTIYLLVKTFPSLESEKKEVGKRYYLFTILILVILIFSLLNIIELNRPLLFNESITLVQGLRISNNGVFLITGLISIVVTFIFSELRDGGNQE